MGLFGWVLCNLLANGASPICMRTVVLLPLAVFHRSFTFGAFPWLGIDESLDWDIEFGFEWFCSTNWTTICFSLNWPDTGFAADVVAAGQLVRLIAKLVANRTDSELIKTGLHLALFLNFWNLKIQFGNPEESTPFHKKQIGKIELERNLWGEDLKKEAPPKLNNSFEILLPSRGNWKQWGTWKLSAPEKEGLSRLKQASLTFETSNHRIVLSVSDDHSKRHEIFVLESPRIKSIPTPFVDDSPFQAQIIVCEWWISPQRCCQFN